MSDPLTIIHGDALSSLRQLDDESVQTCVTSPPYWNLRDYGHDFQIGLEKTPPEYIARLVEVFEEVRRVLKSDGTLWLNMGDSYFGDSPTRKASSEAFSKKWDTANTASNGGLRRSAAQTNGFKPKSLCMIPARLAIALQDAGWYLRCDIIWSKPNPMPESVTDRPTKSHEYIFLLSKNQKYYYDAEVIRDPPAREWWTETRTAPGNPDRNDGGSVTSRPRRTDKQRGHSRRHAGFNDRWDAMSKEEQAVNGRNKRSVWEIATNPFPDAHFATFPPDLIKPCILAGAPIGGVVLDPFSGSGTTAKVAIELGRKAIAIEPKAEYIEMIKKRCQTTIGLPLAI